MQRAAVIAFVALFLLLSFANFNAMTAKYNVQWYKEGKIGWMGSAAVSVLDDSAVEYLLPLYLDDDTNTEVRKDCTFYLQYVYYQYCSDYKNYNYAGSRAHELLSAAGFSEAAFPSA